MIAAHTNQVKTCAAYPTHVPVEGDMGMCLVVKQLMVAATGGLTTDGLSRLIVLPCSSS